jgi:hypothetical protein
LQARNLSEDALAHEVMKNTGVPIPNDNAPRLKREDFLKRMIEERYPEFKLGDDDLNLSMMDDKSVPDGVFNSDNGKIFVKNKPDIIKNLSTALHEGAHKYDYEHLNFDGTDDVSRLGMKDSLPGKRALSDIDPTEAYELMAKGHHAEIPKLREGSFGLGALKSMIKSGTFKALPIIGGAATAATALNTPDASAAIGDAFVPGGLESLGPSQDDEVIENPQANPELRKKALQGMLKR